MSCPADNGGCMTVLESAKAARVTRACHPATANPDLLHVQHCEQTCVSIACCTGLGRGPGSQTPKEIQAVLAEAMAPLAQDAAALDDDVIRRPLMPAGCQPQEEDMYQVSTNSRQRTPQPGGHASENVGRVVCVQRLRRLANA